MAEDSNAGTMLDEQFESGKGAGKAVVVEGIVEVGACEVVVDP